MVYMIKNDELHTLPHYMIDLETLGVVAGSSILSIGIAKFDLPSNRISRTLYRNIDLDSNIKSGLVPKGDTLYWWLRQDKKAAQQLESDRVSLKRAMLDVYDLIKEDPGYVWGNGAGMDIALLRYAMFAVDIEPPWSHEYEMCFRTIMTLTNYNRSTFGTKHHALDDALSQVGDLIPALEELRV